MSAAQDYYNQVFGMGHSPENALAYTRQHYPDFVPGIADAVPAPPPHAVLLWWLLLPDTETDTSAGMGVWMSVLGGVLGVVAGVLAFLDQK
jgi:hypothetical protein